MANVTFPLSMKNSAFAQDAHPLPSAGEGIPGARWLDELRVVMVRHSEASQGARAALESAQIPWPERTGDVQTQAWSLPLVARIQPEQMLFIGPSGPLAHRLIADLMPGRVSDAVAIDLSHGMHVIALQGPNLNSWLARMVDTSAIPTRTVSCARGRLVDMPVLLVRAAEDAMLLVADRAFAPYLAKWLSFGHEGAFNSDAL